MTSRTFEDDVDRLTTQLLVPLRSEKRIASGELDALCEIVASAREEGLFAGLLEARLAGKLWLVFCAMLAEADHARDPDPILDAAWRYQEELRRAFGPTYS